MNLNSGIANGSVNFSVSPADPRGSSSSAHVIWDWDIEHADRKKEEKADAAFHGQHPFQIDRRVLKDVVKEKVGADVGRIVFLSSGELVP
jgi:hypothetical protein